MVDDLKIFKNDSDIIIANRFDEYINDINDKNIKLLQESFDKLNEKRN